MHWMRTIVFVSALLTLGSSYLNILNVLKILEVSYMKNITFKLFCT